MPMTDDEKQLLSETHSMVKELHTSLVGTQLIPGAVPTHSELLKIVFQRVRNLEHWRSVLVGIAMVAGTILGYFKLVAK